MHLNLRRIMIPVRLYAWGALSGSVPIKIHATHPSFVPKIEMNSHQGFRDGAKTFLSKKPYVSPGLTMLLPSESRRQGSVVQHCQVSTLTPGPEETLSPDDLPEWIRSRFPGAVQSTSSCFHARPLMAERSSDHTINSCNADRAEQPPMVVGISNQKLRAS